jgi:hypothetical protein
MNLYDALKIVRELADQNALDEYQAEDFNLQDEAARQRVAIDTVDKFMEII